MVYKYKNNKWSRMIAARKLAATAAAAAAVADQHIDTDAGAAPQVSVETEGLVKVGEADAAGAHAAAATNADQTQKRNDTAQEELFTRATAADAHRVLAAKHSQSTCPLLPRVLDAFHVPSANSTDAASGFMGYVLQRTEEQALDDGGESSGCVPAVMTIYGVCKGGDGEQSCLQVVRWEAASPLSQKVDPHLVDNAAQVIQEEQQQQQQQQRPSQAAPHELLLYVDADGRCFTLAPSSVIAVERQASSKDGSAATAAAVDGGVLSGSSTAAAAYWMVPTVLREHFLTLLQALARWRSLPLTLVSSPSLTTAGVVPHATRWVRDTPTPITTTAAGDTPSTTVPVAVQKDKKMSKKRRRAFMLSRAAAQAVVADKDSACDTSSADAAACLCIPYVVAVENGGNGGGTESFVSSSGSASVVFVLGNRLAPFPADYVL